MKWTKNLQNILETPISFFISKKPGEIPIFGTFLAKKKTKKQKQKQNNFGLYISLKIDIFRSAMIYYVIVTSYVDLFS